MIADNSPNQVDINSILQNLNSKNNQTNTSKPNLKMTIKKRRYNNNNTRRKRSKVVRCKGTLVDRGGKLLPKIKCSSKSIYGNRRNNNRNSSNNNNRNSSSNNNRNSSNSNNNENEMSVNLGVHGENSRHVSQNALSEIMGEITKLRSNNKYFNSLKNNSSSPF